MLYATYLWSTICDLVSKLLYQTSQSGTGQKRLYAVGLVDELVYPKLAVPSTKGSRRNKKCHKKWKKFKFFLTTPPPSSPRMIWTFLNLGKKWKFDAPPLGPNLEKFVNRKILNFGKPTSEKKK